MGFKLRFADREITARGEMGLMKRMLDRIGFESAVEECGLPQPSSNRGYAPIQLILQFMLSVWSGANQFEHKEVTRHDPALQKLFGFKHMANFKTIMRLFGKFGQATTAAVFGRLYRWFFGNLHIDHLTLDLDSTEMTRYGLQQCAARGYNSRKPGRYSHHLIDSPCFRYTHDSQSMATSRQ